MMIGLTIISLTSLTMANDLDKCKKKFNDCYQRYYETNEKLKIANENLKTTLKREDNRDLKFFAIGAGAGFVVSFSCFFILFYRR